MVSIIQKYFPDLTTQQMQQFDALEALYKDWNAKINVISRKDIDALYTNHVLHSLAIAKFISFEPTTKVLDIGTGGGFPGIPLAIMFPQCQFTLVDSIAKKIKVAEGVAQGIGLTNVDFAIGRVEHINQKFDFITARAVAPLNELFKWTANSLENNKQFNAKINGYLLLKGGDLSEEINEFKLAHKKWRVRQLPLTDFFEEAFFETKKLLYVYV